MLLQDCSWFELELEASMSTREFFLHPAESLDGAFNKGHQEIGKRTRSAGVFRWKFALDFCEDRKGGCQG